VPDISLHTALQESVDEVLEKMFFIRSFGEPQDSAREPEFVAHLTFEGDPPGWLALCVTAPAARSVSADFLGEEKVDLSEQQIGEVVCELANMICGSVLSRVENNSGFRRATPRLLPPGQPSERGFPVRGGSSSAATHSAGVGNGRLMVIFNTETPAWSAAEKHAF
jgi:CheY-specific phosphatase CheX